jgi:hypothetical protein
MTTIITKNSSTASAAPAAGDLTKGELAVNVTDKKLYTKDNSAAVVKIVGSLGNQEANAVAITGGSVTGITDITVADGGTGASTAADARTNLGVTATGADTAYAFRSNNLSDLASASTARTNLGLGTIATQAASSVAITGGSVTGITDITVADGGTGASTAANARTNLGAAASGANSDITSLTGLTTALTVAQGGTGTTTSTGSGNVVLSTSPTLVTPALGTPSALVGTNITGTASGLTAGSVTTNANLTGAVTSVGNATSLGSFTSSQLATALTDETGSGANVFATSPTLVTPILGTPTSATLTNATGLPLTTGVTGLLPVANGGTGTATPSIVAGTNVTVTGTWPNQTIAASGGGGGSGGITYTTVKTANYTAANNDGVQTNTTSGAFTVTLPATPSNGHQVIVVDSFNTWGTNNLTIGRNGSTIEGLAQDLVCDITGVSVQCIYNGTTWDIFAQVGGAGGASQWTTTGSDIYYNTGNVAVGITTPSSWNTLKAIEQQNGVFWASYSGDADSYFGANAYYSSGWFRKVTGNATYYRQTTGQHQWAVAASSTAGSAISFTQAMTLDADGGLKTLNTIGVGNATPSTSGAGITFPATQSASSNANTLDDYEEGTFTFTVNFGGSNADNASGTFTGYYTKVGRALSIQASFQIPTKSAATGNLTITGLPFSVIDSSAVYIGGVFEMGFTDYPSARIDTGTTIQFFQTTNAGSRSALTNSNCNNNFGFQFSSTYFTT